MPSAPASKRATSPARNCGPIATARLLISSCTPLAKPRYTRIGATPATVFTLLARPWPANTRRPSASRTVTQESAEKLKRSRARPAPAVASGCSGEAARAAGGAAAAEVKSAGETPDGAADGAPDDGASAGALDRAAAGSAPDATAPEDRVAPSADVAPGF